jgi:hypothetical protein
MLRGTITLADRGAFLRACDRLGFPLFTVLNARPAARAAVWEAVLEHADSAEEALKILGGS